MRRVLYLGVLSMVVVLVLSLTAFAQDEEGLLFCEDFDSQAEAQQHLRDDPSDPDELDEEEGEDDGIACETFSYDNPEKDLNPVSAAIDQPEGESETQPTTQPQAAPKQQPNAQPKETPKQQPNTQPKEAPRQQNELMDAGGDLPVPQEPLGGAGGGFTLWRVIGMVLAAGVFAFAVYRIIS